MPRNILNRFLSICALAIFIAMFRGAAVVDAAEVATLVNRTRYRVQLYLKWSHLRNESTLITLDPGRNLRQTGPDGAVLVIRFNTNPVGPILEAHHRVITQRTYPDRPGFVSYFREGPQRIFLSAK